MPPIPVKVLRSPTDELQFVIEFVEVDLADASKKTLTTVERNIRFLVGQEGSEPFLPRTTARGWLRAPRLSVATLVRLQRDVRRVLKGLMEDSRASTDVEIRLRYAAVRWSIAPTRGTTAEPLGEGVSVWVHGSSRNRLLHRLMRLINTLGTKLRTCPGCGRLFVKVTRKRYCSSACQNRLYMRGRRAKERCRDGFS